ncbi:unnamed protein product, partial [Ectocarpus fasciculatus]
QQQRNTNFHEREPRRREEVQEVGVGGVFLGGTEGCRHASRVQVRVCANRVIENPEFFYVVVCRPGNRRICSISVRPGSVFLFWILLHQPPVTHTYMQTNVHTTCWVVIDRRRKGARG